MNARNMIKVCYFVVLCPTGDQRDTFQASDTGPAPPSLWFNSISQILVNGHSLHMMMNIRWRWFSENFYNSKIPNSKLHHCNCHIWFTARQMSFFDENVAIVFKRKKTMKMEVKMSNMAVVFRNMGRVWKIFILYLL